MDAGIAELQRLLQADCSLDSPSLGTSLGVSPPVRSGAANPLAQNGDWRATALAASRTSLKALAELEGRGGAPFLRPSSTGGCGGDFGLLSPHGSLGDHPGAAAAASRPASLRGWPSARSSSSWTTQPSPAESDVVYGY